MEGSARAGCARTHAIAARCCTRVAHGERGQRRQVAEDGAGQDPHTAVIALCVLEPGGSLGVIERERGQRGRLGLGAGPGDGTEPSVGVTASGESFGRGHGIDYRLVASRCLGCRVRAADTGWGPVGNGRSCSVALGLEGAAVPKVVITMPAYQAERTLERTVLAIPDGRRGRADPGRRREPRRHGRARADARPAASHVHPENRGYGGNQKSCYRLALDADADIVVLLHPDYQYEPKAVPLADRADTWRARRT